MIGKRIYPDEQGHMSFAEGDYGKDADGIWKCRPPGAMLGSLQNHTVVEHEDGAITVSPSILIYQHSAKYPEWHGFLEHGVWRKA